MKTPKLFLFLVVLGFLGCAIFAWRQNLELRELRTAAVTLDERGDWQRRVRALEKVEREQREQLAAIRVATPAAKPAGPAAPVDAGHAAVKIAAAEDKAGALQQQTAAIRELMEKAEVQAMLSAQRKAGVEQRYAELFKRLNLSPEQAQKVTTLLQERANIMQDLIAVAREQGTNLRENPAAFRQLVTETQNQINESIKGVLGENGFEQLGGYEKTTPQRNLVQDLAQRLNNAGHSLNPAQAESLVQILAAHPPQRVAVTRQSAPTTTGGAPTPNRVDAGAIVRTATTTVPGVGLLLGVADDSGRPAVPGYPITPAAVSQAQGILTPPQLAALQQLHEQQQIQTKLRTLVTETLVRPPAAVTPGLTPKGG